MEMTRTLGLRQVVTSSEVAIMASPCCIGELEQVVDGADHRPLGSDLVEATEEELAEASCMLDLAEHGLDDLLSEAVATAPTGALELCRHGGLARSFRPTPRTGGMGLAVTCPAGSQIGGDPAAGEMGKIFVVAVSGVGRDFLGIGTQHRADVGEERDQRVGVRGAGLQAWRCR